MPGGAFVGLHVKCQPFLEDTDDNLQSASLLSTVLTLVGALQLMAATPHDDPFKVMLFIMAVNLVVFVMAIYTAATDTIPSIIEEYQGYYADLEAVACKIRALSAAAAPAAAAQVSAAPVSAAQAKLDAANEAKAAAEEDGTVAINTQPEKPVKAHRSEPGAAQTSLQNEQLPPPDFHPDLDAVTV